MDVKKNHVLVGKERRRVYDQELIYAPVIGLLTSSREINFNDVLAYKLTPDMQAPAKQVVLTNTKNKIQLNAMLTEGILDPG